MLTIRSERKQDYAGITAVNDLAFGQTFEGSLVEKLRINAAFIPDLSLVAESDGQIVGHILFFPVTINNAAERHVSLALAPMSVIPEGQRRGVGGKLIVEGLKRARALNFRSVIVIGHQEYYPRFGFRPASAWNIKTDYPVPDEVFMAIELIPDGLKGVTGKVEYPREFEEDG